MKSRTLRGPGCGEHAATVAANSSVATAFGHTQGTHCSLSEDI
jgi:hypothetical protein